MTNLTRTPASAAREGRAALLAARDATLAYGRATIAEHLTAEMPAGSFTAIIGPNACGKSTLLRALARILRPARGTVELDGRSLSAEPSRAIARRIGLLPQSALAPEGIRVVDLVARGRAPHRSPLRRWSDEDERAVATAMRAARVEELADRLVDELSGGQRQRAWIAMLLAQETEILLLDEPTTFLDLAYQIDLLELLRELREEGRTVVAVLHDLNQAARYATRLVVMKAGEIVAVGEPGAVVTRELVRDVFGLDCLVVPDPVAGTPCVVPLGGRIAEAEGRAPGARGPSDREPRSPREGR